MLSLAIPAIAAPFLPRYAASDSFGWEGSIDVSGPYMPRIHDDLAHSIGFLYRTKEEAERNESVGGTCFLVGKPAEGCKAPDGGQAWFFYAVTNYHVAWGAKCSVIRLNRRDGHKQIIDLTHTDWTPHADGSDVAAVFLSYKMGSGSPHIRMIETTKFLRENEVAKLQVGVGDDVFMIGRFMNHQGNEDAIKPAFRFGNISVGPEPIWNSITNAHEISFGAEMRSRTGFSGAPVTVYRSPFGNPFNIKAQENAFWRFLGVNWGYIVEEKTRENTWLNGIVPAWRVLELLEEPALKDQHDAATEAILRLQKGHPDSAIPSVASAASLPANDANPKHREDFTRLVGAAARKPEPKD